MLIFLEFILIPEFICILFLAIILIFRLFLAHMNNVFCTLHQRNIGSGLVTWARNIHIAADRYGAKTYTVLRYTVYTR